MAELQARQRRVLYWVLCINVGTFVMMVAGSVISGSSALLSGTLDNLGDALTYGLSLAVIGASVVMKARVALFKGALILFAAAMVAVQIAVRLSDLSVPLAVPMGIAAVLNLAANAVCLAVLYPHRGDDVNMSSMWECSRNDVFDGVAVILAAALVWLFQSGWPDVLVALALLVLFLRSALRVISSARAQLKTVTAEN